MIRLQPLAALAALRCIVTLGPRGGGGAANPRGSPQADPATDARAASTPLNWRARSRISATR